VHCGSNDHDTNAHSLAPRAEGLEQRT
jgi:hypothetical protein